MKLKIFNKRLKKNKKKIDHLRDKVLKLKREINIEEENIFNNYF